MRPPLDDPVAETFAQARILGHSRREAAMIAGYDSSDAVRAGRMLNRRMAVRDRIVEVLSDLPGNASDTAYAYWAEIFDRFLFNIGDIIGPDMQFDLSGMTRRDAKALEGCLAVTVRRRNFNGRSDVLINRRIASPKSSRVWSAMGKFLDASAKRRGAKVR